MSKYIFKPRDTFTKDLNYLSKIDKSIRLEIKSAIDILVDGEKSPDEYDDHELQRKFQGYREFHVRDTPKGIRASEKNDVIVIYKKQRKRLILIGVRVGSHDKLFKNMHK